VLQNLSLNSAQVITDCGGFIVKMDSHQHVVGPVDMYEVYHSFSSSLQLTASNFLYISISQSSASIGSMADEVVLCFENLIDSLLVLHYLVLVRGFVT
jgi:hypothetical protein